MVSAPRQQRAEKEERVDEGKISVLWSFLAIAALVLANGFFVAAEFALVSIRHSRVEELVTQGVGVAKVIRSAVRNLDRYIAGTQVGITLASLGLGWIGEPALARQLEPLLERLPPALSTLAQHSIAVTIAFIIITVLHVILGELVPKSLALQKPEGTAMVVARPMALIVLLLQPLIWLLNGIGNTLLRAAGLQAAGEYHGVHSSDELSILVRQSHAAGVLDDMERQMLQRTFRFSGLSARDVMIPRLDMVALDVTKPIDELLDRAAQTIHTRFPVYEETIDNVIGVLHTQDLFRRVRHAPENINLRNLARPPLIVPETTDLDALIEHFRDHHTQIAIVVDEHGGTEGLVTLEDIIEEVFGELQDMLEAEQPDIQEMEDGRILVRGDVHLHELDERLEWKLDDEDADTIAGYIMAKLGRTARLGDVIETTYGTVRVENMARLRITQVSLGRRMPHLDDVDDRDAP